MQSPAGGSVASESDRRHDARFLRLEGREVDLRTDRRQGEGRSLLDEHATVLARTAPTTRSQLHAEQ